MPNLASRNHSGHSYWASESHVGWNGPEAVAALDFRNLRRVRDLVFSFVSFSFCLLNVFYFLPFAHLRLSLGRVDDACRPAAPPRP